MEFSIIIPSVDNYKFCKLTVDSIKKNSTFNHEIIISLIEKYTSKEELDYFNNLNVKIYLNKSHKGFCTSVNSGLKLATKEYITLSDDDMYYLPKWDEHLIKEIHNLNHSMFFLSSTMLENKKINNKIYTKFSKRYPNHIYYNGGNNPDDFNEDKILSEFNELKFHNWNGTHHTPCVIHRTLVDKIKGMSEEFNPASGSDPDFCMKLWNEGVRIFKGVNKSRVYHFGSKTTRRGNITMNDGHKTFLKKWGITIDFFIEHYLKRGTPYNGELKINKNFYYYFDLIICKIKFFIQY